MTESKTDNPAASQTPPRRRVGLVLLLVLLVGCWSVVAR